ncbi:SF II RNA helicase [Cryptosporidium ubiquitum]|uniref:ATP-dependent RNA helicase n=1 Tax=Cryptosporidium ubiquitum TaxID=857276 RepID=A0A1J4MFR8_9CRYT|nr:SF II RNA helicase [Cryptosporidium ubiquitum]OII73072.1 SF II RNA helicase [Cryptosporidium ubiquitum]
MTIYRSLFMFSKDLNKNEIPGDIKLKINHNIRFSDFNLHRCLIDALLCNGLIFPSPVQYHVLSQGAIEENLIVQAKSGTGKTIAFVLFILNKLLNHLDHDLKQFHGCFELQSLLIAPTREICIQINKTISMFLNSIKDNYLIDNICCIGGSPISEDFEEFNLNTPTIMVSTPGRFIQLMNYEPNKFLSVKMLRKSLFFLLFDEADRLLEDCFIEQSKHLLELCLGSSTTQFIACSATFPMDKLQLLKRMLLKININAGDCKLLKLRQIQLCSSFGTNYRNIDNIEAINYVQDVRNTDGMNSISKLAISNTLESPVLKNMNFFLYDLFLNEIFQLNAFDENNYHQWAYLLNSIVDVLIRVPFRQSLIFTNNGSVGYKIMSALKSLNIPVSYTSGKRSQIEREEIITSLNENRCRVVVCSDLLARGIDIKMIDLVINVDVPIDKETFLHRAGRSGRFGQKGIVVCIPSHKQDYDSFLYFYNQLEINFLSFCEQFNHVEKNNKSYPSYDNTDLSLGINSILTPPVLESSEDVFAGLEDSKDNNLNEKSENIDLSCSTINVTSLDYYKTINDLQITNIDRDILDFWRLYKGITI